MAKFIEVTNRNDKKKRLISIEQIISVIEEPDGKAFIEFYAPHKSKINGMSCVESYVDVYNYFATYEYI